MNCQEKDIINDLIHTRKISLESLENNDSNVDCFYDGIVSLCYKTIFKDRDLEMCTDVNYYGTHYFFLTNQNGGIEAYICFYYLNDEQVYFCPEDCELSFYKIVIRFLVESNERIAAERIEKIECKAYTSDYLDNFKGNANERKFINIENDERFEDEITSNPGTSAEKKIFICSPVVRELGIQFGDYNESNE